MIAAAGTRRAVIRAVRDRSLRHTPGLRSLIRLGVRRGCIPAAVWRRLHPVGSWTLHAPDGTPFTYTAYPHDGLARHVVWTDMRDWEASTQAALFELARHARVFVDVGAYSGLYTVLACLANAGLRVVSFEPNPVKFPQLRVNVTANGLLERVTIVGKALSSHAGRATLAIPSDDSTATLRTAAHGERAVEVEVVTGDDALAGLPVGLIKIDVEGLEPEVLRGMTGVLRAHRPAVIAECLTPRAFGRVWRVVSGLGYRHVRHLGGPSPMCHPNYLFTVDPWPGRC